MKQSAAKLKRNKVVKIEDTTSNITLKLGENIGNTVTILFNGTPRTLKAN